ncbi:hypothetical protein [Pseudonocardia sp. GCM10023141]|uniref:hypothetical protein n=1 Tax=Pseudonocardia sp. GCM10023141 TaxID=3252653 RepID=UPI00361A66F2
MLEVLGILMIVQGVGGFINNWIGGSPSWFLVNYVPFLDGWEMPASAVLAVVGAVVAERGAKLRKRAAKA